MHHYEFTISAISARLHPDHLSEPFLSALSTIAHTHESLHTFSAVSTMSIIAKIGRMMPMMPTGAPGVPAMSDSVRK